MDQSARQGGILSSAGRSNAAGWAWALVLGAIATSGGCWQEVTYDPATRPPRQSSSDASEDGSRGDPVGTGETVATDIFGGDVSGGEPVDAGPIDAAPTAPAEAAVPPGSTGGAMPAPSVTATQRETAWSLASNWAFAAAYAGRGRPTAEYAALLDQASAAAQELGIVLPELPAPPDPKRLAADMATALRGRAGEELASAVGHRLDAAAAGATRLAITAHVLLLVYTPLEADAPTLARELREAGVASQLPPELWQPLVELVSRRSEYETVKSAVRALPQKIRKHYADAAAGGL
jgi:hypothetical protein